MLNLTCQPTGSSNERLKRNLLIHISGDFPVNSAQNLKIQPLTYFEIQNGYVNGGLGAALESKYLAINIVALGDSEKNLDIQAGFSLTTGRITLYYNYRFNAISGNKLMPVSLLHQAGLAFSLNNVEKRNINQNNKFS